jgi:hypothetical protein
VILSFSWVFRGEFGSSGAGLGASPRGSRPADGVARRPSYYPRAGRCDSGRRVGGVRPDAAERRVGPAGAMSPPLRGPSPPNRFRCGGVRGGGAWGGGAGGGGELDPELRRQSRRKRKEPRPRAGRGRAPGGGEAQPGTGGRGRDGRAPARPDARAGNLGRAQGGTGNAAGHRRGAAQSGRTGRGRIQARRP